MYVPQHGLHIFTSGFGHGNNRWPTVMGTSASAQHARDGSRRKNEATLTSLKAGDLVKFHRIGYYHWAVYIGNSEVVHVSEQANYDSPSGKSLLRASLDLSKVNINVENFWTVAGSDSASKANDRDQDWSPLPSEEIVERALSFVGLGNVRYNVFKCNCEHFAKWCRYDKFHSDQVHRLKIYKKKVLVKTVISAVDAAKDKIKSHISNALDHHKSQKVGIQNSVIEENNNTL